MDFILTLLIQISVIIIISRITGLIFRKIQQPNVVSEMVAGIILGPSLLGWLFPGVFTFIFPAESLKFLNTLSQIGLLLFMFIVGLEIDPKLLKGRGHAALLISHVSIVLPFILGALISIYLYPQLSNNSVSFTSFALFMGASMSITAFPVLARILSERNLIKTKIGSITIACAAIDDVTAWSILAIVVTVARAGSNMHPFWFTISGAFIFVLIMIFVVRPLIRKFETYFHYRGDILSNNMLAAVLLLMMLSAWVTEWLGIHALFGAFFMGAIMPRNKYFLNSVFDKLNDITVVFFLPVFFALTGIRTSIGLVNGAEMWMFFAIILIIAVVGKLGGASVAAKISSLSTRESLGIGILMNTRGLMELIILSIGLELGIISPALFAMMVLMALVTTFMTTPFFEWVYPRRLIQKEIKDANKEKFKVLIPVSFPSSGPGLLKIASAISPDKNEFKAYALHLKLAKNISVPDISSENGKSNDLEVFQPIVDSAKNTAIEISPLSYISRNPGNDINYISELKNVDSIIMGWHKPVFSESIFSGTVNDVMHNAKTDVCVYLERKFETYKNILVPFREGNHDRSALQMAYQISKNTGAMLTVLHIVNKSSDGTVMNVNGVDKVKETQYLKEELGEDYNPEMLKLEIVESDSPLNTAIRIANQDYDLVVVGMAETWGIEPSSFSRRHERLARECPASLLILRKYTN